MKATVQQLIDTRARSRLFRRKCCCQEKSAKSISLVTIAAVMAAYAYVVISTNITKFSIRTISAFPVIVPSLSLPGLLICTTSNDIASGWLVRNASYYLTTYFDASLTSYFQYGDPRIQMVPFADTRAGAVNPNLQCCKTSGAGDFFASCWAAGTNNCGVQTQFLKGISGSFVSAPTAGVAARNWGFRLDCINVPPGIQVTTTQDALYLPYFILQDFGVFATDANGENITTSLAVQDYGYQGFLNNWVFFPQKLVIVSYNAEEYPNGVGVDPVGLYLGTLDAKVGGPQGRIRADIGIGFSSISISRFTYTNFDGTPNSAQTGWTVGYDQNLPPIVWSLAPSQWNPHRVAATYLSYTRVRCSTSVLQTKLVSLFTVLELITATLAIIGSSTALVTAIIGPGEHNPNGLINRVFYSDVPMLKNTASDAVFKIKTGKDQGKGKEKENGKEKKKGGESPA